ncbi:unnamed protein product [Alopecurus aequalis]
MVGGVASKMPAMLWLLAALLALAGAVGLAEGAHNTYEFIVKDTKYHKLCLNKTLLTVNDQWPGPTITARRGDNVTVHVSNQGHKNITIHWHGVDQPRNPWFDGPEFITQCPIMPGQNFTYHIVLSEEEGTIWWHAHSDLDRAGIHGAFIIHPKIGQFPPYQPKMPMLEEHTIILGEWWKGDLEKVFEDHVLRGGEINSSDAHTINGMPGDFFRCSQRDLYRGYKNQTFVLSLEARKTYLLRIINAGMDNDMFFGIASHKLTVVGTDGRYLKPFTVEIMMISPGQTMDVLLTTDQPMGQYYIASRPYASNTGLAINNGTASAIVHYKGSAPTARPVGPNLPPSASDDIAIAYTAQLKSLNSKEHPVNVPKTVDKHILITIAVNMFPCLTGNGTCDGPRGNRLGASLNNVSFEDPPKRVDILDAYYYHITNNTSTQGVYTEDFPDKPEFFFNFTDNTESRNFLGSKKGTKVTVVEYGTVVEVVFQDTAILGAENHPMHLHGFAFYVVGRGLGNFNNVTSPATYNLVDPPYQNTVTVPKAGWAALRFNATNPGVWFMHCHFDRHTVFGMSSVFIVKDGPGKDQKMGPRPSTMPVC